MAQAYAECGHDEREFADLGDSKPGEETRASAVAHETHDGQDHEGVAHQHETGEEKRIAELGAGRPPFQACAEVDKEEQQKEVAQACKPCADGFPVGC